MNQEVKKWFPFNQEVAALFVPLCKNEDIPDAEPPAKLTILASRYDPLGRRVSIAWCDDGLRIICSDPRGGMDFIIVALYKSTPTSVQNAKDAARFDNPNPQGPLNLFEELACGRANLPEALACVTQGDIGQLKEIAAKATSLLREPQNIES